MKKIFTISIVLLVVAFYGYYSYRKVVNYQVSPQEKEYIEKHIFGQDSEKRGYSDRAKKLMLEDLSIFNNDKKITIMYDKFLKQQRTMILANSQKEYYDSYVKYIAIRNCIVRYKVRTYPNKRFKYLLRSGNSYDSERMFNSMIVKHDKYTRNLSYKEKSTMYNYRMTDKDCNEVSNN